MIGERYEEAVVSYDTALRLAPIRPAYWIFNLAWSYLGNKQYDKAILLLTESVERDPDYLSAFEGLTSAYQLSGNSEKARWAAENVMRINPKFSIDTEENKWPFKDEALKKRHSDALRSAGLK